MMSQKTDDSTALYNFNQKLVDATLKLYGSSNIPLKQVDYIFNMVQDLFQAEHNSIKIKLDSHMNNESSAKKIKDNIVNVLNSNHKSIKQFNTEYNRLQILEQDKFYLPPIEFVIGIRCAVLKWNHEGDPVSKPKNATAILFLLRAMLKKVFEMPGIYDTVSAYKQKLEKQSNITSNFIQSPIWKKKIKNCVSKDNVYPLFLFSDDFETGNCFGSHAGSNKLCGTYVSIPCFPPHLSSLNSLFQALIYYSKDRQEYGNFSVFRTLMIELEVLEKNGVDINLIDGRKIKLFFKLGLILGDNLGLHSILGFTESFNSTYSCRFCKMDTVQRSLASLEDKKLLRDKESYETDILLKDPSSTGVKEKCIFNRLSNFHVLDNVVVDIMHDFIEGVVHRDMCDILDYYINKVKLFSLIDLTSQIKLHDFGEFDIKNKPPEILQNHLKNKSLKMLAGEMLLFVRHFGIIMGDLIPDDDVVYRLYLNLVNILDIILARSIHKNCKGFLKTLVSEHHTLVLTIFNRHCKTKEHNLIHYDTVMHTSGPLINFSGMRWEAKHKESKMLAVVSNSKVNICQTLGVKHQLKFAYLVQSNTMFPTELLLGELKKVTTKTLYSVHNDECLIVNKLSHKTVNSYDWIEKRGIKYKSRMVLCTSHENQKLNFGIINDIIIENDIIYFSYQKLLTVFDVHCHAFKIINLKSDNYIVSYEDLVDIYPVSLIQKNDEYYILQHYLA